MTIARIGFIGLGTMGGPMAANLLRKGFELSVYDVVPAAVERAVGQGARAASGPADAARGADALITMLPDGPVVRDALFGPDGAVPALERGTLVIEMSTIAPSQSDALRRDLEAAGLRMLDAPVGRTPRHAEAGTLLVMAGGAEADVAEATPLFEAMADTIHHIGPAGHGIRLKVVNNYMSMVGMVMTAEALTLAAKAGLDRDTAVRVMSGTAAGRGQLIMNYPNKVLAGDITPDFPLRMGLKDISLALQFGAELSSPLPLGAAARELFALAPAWGRDGQDCTAMLLLMEDLARVVRAPAER